MRAVRRLVGLQQARAALLAHRGIEPEELPPALLERTRQVVGSDVRTAEEAVARIIALVRERGDAALRELGRAFDGVEPDELRVPDAEISAAAARVPPATLAALE